jgi:hypothetical protein
MEAPCKPTLVTPWIVILRGVFLSFIGLLGVGKSEAANTGGVIICRSDAPANVRLAAREVRRYIYLRTDQLLPIVAAPRGGTQIKLRIDSSLAEQEYRLKTDGPVLTIASGSDVGVLYGAYAFAEKLGVRFYLHGDTIPDEKIPFVLPELDETRRPSFALRGLLPFHDFPEGPDWWTREDWLAYVAQAAKLRMNFIGLHTYPFGNKDLGPEPTVWIGVPQDVNEDGTVKVSDYASWYTTAKHQPYGCYAPAKTSSYSFGGASVFPSDDFGPEVNGPEDYPFPKTPAANVALINRTGAFLREVFAAAHRRGIKTCVGTESPLDVPDGVKARLKELGLRPDDPATIRKVYEGVFLRISRAYPVDWYWLWTPEGWTWEAVSEAQVTAATNDLLAAHGALKSLGMPFHLATCGWVLGPQQDRSLFDKILPKDVALSCINREVGKAPVDAGFAAVSGRGKWAIPWLEDDPGMTSPQLWAGRMRKDAADALRYGCDGLMGLHWRTRILALNVAALATAAWDQNGTNTPAATQSQTNNSRFLPVDDFYSDWARAEFGAAVAQPVAAIFTRLDGRLPRASDWVRGPGVVVVNRKPWTEIAPEHAFVEELAALRPQVKGAGNLERFDWWLNTMRYNRAMARLGCARGALDILLEKINQEPDATERRRLAREEALPRRRELVPLLAEMYAYLLATLHNASELGTLCNLEQQSMLRTKLITAHDAQLEEWLGAPLPADAHPWPDYRGPARLVVLTARGLQRAGESLPLRIVALDRQPMKKISAHIRPLGEGNWKTIQVKHLARAVYEARLPAARRDFEYHLTAETAGGQKLIWPATAPAMNQTVVVAD